jgi:Uma2 family endonuclease
MPPEEAAMKTLKRRARGNRHNGNGPTWDIARLFPDQGTWSVEEYLALSGNHLVEFSAGFVEVLPMPTTAHQWIVTFLWEALNRFTSGWGGLGLALTAPLRVELWAGKFREPDIVFMLAQHKDRAQNEFWKGADLVMEVVSDDPEDRRRDLKTKWGEYARARIAEYWMVDLKLRQITVLRLRGKTYDVHGVFKNGQTATSRLLAGFGVEVRTVFAGP